MERILLLVSEPLSRLGHSTQRDTHRAIFELYSFAVPMEVLRQALLYALTFSIWRI